MTQQYTPVTWQDETTSQQGTLINAERLNQMQTAHHYADGFEEVDAIPTADPGVEYHKIVYCTADATIYRWDGTAWTADIDDETKRLLQQEIARATEAESTLRGQLEDEHDARVDAEAAINDRITDEVTELGQRIVTEASTRYTADTALGTRITNETSARETADTGLGNRITAEATARADADTALGGRIDTEQARAEAAEQANAQAIANTYTKAEADTLLAGKADVATTYSKTETDALLALKADQATTYTKTETDTLLGAKADQATTYTKAEVDTLLGAKADASNVVTLNTVQTILATKNIVSNNLRVKDINYPVYSTPTDNRQAILLQMVGNDDIWAYRDEFWKYSSGAARIQHRLRTPLGEIDLRQDVTSAGEAVLFAIGQRAYTAGNTNDVATIGTLDAYTPMIRTTGNQTKSGILTFTSYLDRYDATSTNTLFGEMKMGNIDRTSLTSLRDFRLIRLVDVNGLEVFRLQMRKFNNTMSLYATFTDSQGSEHGVTIASYTES